MNTKKRLFTIFTVLVGAFLLTRPPIDADFGWHYKFGEYIVNTGRIPRENLFSYTLPDYQWSNSYWLSEVVMYLLYNHLGFVLASLVFSLILMVTIYKTVLKQLPPILSFLFGMSLTPLMGFFIVTVRPLFFSTVFMIILLWVLLERRACIKYLPLMFILWANTHPDFLLGFFVLGLFTLEELYKTYRKSGKVFEPKKLAPVTVPVILSFLATFINPYTYNLWFTLLGEINNVSFTVIYEVMPMIYVKEISTFMAVHLTVGIVLAFIYWQRKSLDKWYLGAIIFFFIFSSKSMYFYRVFYIIGIFSVSKGLLSLIETLKHSGLDFTMLETPFRKLFPVIAFFITLISVHNLIYITDHEAWLSEHEFPYQAVAYVKKNPPEGRMFNTYDWGGYLIWQLPEYKTFADGRMASWKISENKFLLEDYRDMAFYTFDNQDLIDQYVEKSNVKWAFLKKDSKIQAYLHKTKGWQEVFSGPFASILIKPN